MLNHKKRLVTAISVLAALNAALLGGVAVPSIRSTGSLLASIADGRKKLDDHPVAMLALRKSAEFTAEDRGKVQELGEAFIVGGDEIRFITDMETLADTSGVKQSLSLETVNQRLITSWQSEVPVFVTFTGPYPAAMRHLRAIESLPYVLTIRDLNIASSKDAGGTVQVSLRANALLVGKNPPKFVLPPVGQGLR